MLIAVRRQLSKSRDQVESSLIEENTAEVNNDIFGSCSETAEVIIDRSRI